jgi:antagonist of KipI
MIEVIHPGLLTTIQDSGRYGYEAYGMPPSGAFDPFLASIANKLVGNSFQTPLLEFALIGPTLRFLKDCWIGIAAFSCQYLLDEVTVPKFSAFQATSMSFLKFRSMDAWFGYIAVSGGIQETQILGSVSTYVSGKIGKKLIREQQIRTHTDTSRHYSLKRDRQWFPDSHRLRILPSIHTSEFSSSELLNLTEYQYRISPQSNRMGILLNGPPIEAPKVKRSVPALPGAIQVQPSGEIMILGPEGPTTGGYPQIGILSETAWTQLSQFAPGKTIQLEWQDPEHACSILQERNQMLKDENNWNLL